MKIFKSTSDARSCEECGCISEEGGPEMWNIDIKREDHYIRLCSECLLSLHSLSSPLSILVRTGTDIKGEQ